MTKETELRHLKSDIKELLNNVRTDDVKELELIVEKLEKISYYND